MKYNEGKSDKAVASEGLLQMEGYMKELNLVMDIRELGVTEEMLGGIAAGTFTMGGGYKAPNHDEIVERLKASMA